MTTLTTLSSLKSAVIEAMLHELQGEELSCVGDAENILDDVELHDVGEVIYNHDALQILDNSDFEEAEDLDFSHCNNAMQCVMMEAQGKVTGTVFSIAGDMRHCITDLLDELFSIDSVAGMYVESVDVLRGGSVLDSVPHDREEDLSAGDYVVSGCFYLSHNAVTATFEGVTFKANLVNEIDNDDE